MEAQRALLAGTARITAVKLWSDTGPSLIGVRGMGEYPRDYALPNFRFILHAVLWYAYAEKKRQDVQMSEYFAAKADVMEAVSEVKISIERLENKLWKYLLVVAIPSIISTAIGIALLIFNILNLLPAQ